MYSLLIASASMLWLCNASGDQDQSSVANGQSASVNRIYTNEELDRDKQYHVDPDSVEDIMKRMSGQSKRFFQHPQKPAVRHALTSLSQAYQGGASNAYVPIDRDRIHADFAAKGRDGKATIYGEVMPEGVLHMLALASQTNPHLKDADGKPKAGSWVDLGSGLGKTVMLASLLGWEGDGFELASPRMNIACESLDRLEGNDDKGQDLSSQNRTGCGGDGPGKAKYTLGSFEEDAVDLSHADVAFTDSVYWTPEMMATLGQKASKMKPGSIIFSYKLFPSPEGTPDKFEHLGQVNLPVSWAKEGTFWHMQQVK